MSEPNERSRRVVVTGVGLATGLGLSRELSWQALRQGRHAFRFLPLEAGPGSPSYAGCPSAIASPIPLAERVAREAMCDAGLLSGDRGDAVVDVDPDRIATVIGMSKGDVHALARAAAGGDLSDWVRAWPFAASARVSAMFGARGPSLVPVAACATGLIAALRGAALIREGVCDVALAGATDESLDPLVLGAFRKMGVLARVGSDPGRAVRPWDRDRSGFLVGAGAAVLVLEREDHARARGALPYCTFAGGAFGADAHHLTALDLDPSNLAGLIGRALGRAGVGASEIDHVNVHGTATASNDPLECQAIRRAIGPHADRVSCSANKAQIGHCLGAAGAVELAITCLSVRDQFVPPTLNLDDPDPLCDLDATPHVGRARPIRAALKLSLGFGGHLAVAVLRQADGPRREVLPNPEVESS